MSITNGSGSPPLSLEQSRRVRVANLVSEGIDHNPSHVEAQVALVWPYSSSTREFAFLLSEHDARPLKSGRQLKVVLHNGAARTVQAAKVGIGDNIRLLLDGAETSQVHDQNATPGKRSQFDLSFRTAVTLEVGTFPVDDAVY